MDNNSRENNGGWQDFESLEYPKSRVATFDVGKIGNRKHHVFGLLEVDVTLAKERISDLLKMGNDIGFTSWVIKTIGDTVSGNRFIQAINWKSGKQAVFKDVDISIPVEKDIGGVKAPLVAVIRKANEKSVEEIQKEIRAFSMQAVRSEADYVLGERENSLSKRLFFNMPQWMRLFVWRIILGNPFIRKNAMGTVMVTNVLGGGYISGWIVPKSLHNLCFGIGSVNKKPWVRNGKVEVRDILHLTVLVDHDVVDGSPAGRFMTKLVANLEKAAGL